MSQSGDRISPVEYEQMRNHHAMDLLLGINDSYALLVTQFINIQKQADEFDQLTVDALVDGQTNILEFLQSGSFLINAIPRTPRKDKDRIRFAQGQHAGVSVQVVSEVTGLVTRLNYYGALRDPGHHMDEHDSRNRRLIHSDRSLTTASETANIDLHMISLAQTDPFLDLWLELNLKRLLLSKFNFEHTRYDVKTSISNQDRRFRPQYSRLNAAMKNLAMMVPNPYSPR